MQFDIECAKNLHSYNLDGDNDSIIKVTEMLTEAFSYIDESYDKAEADTTEDRPIMIKVWTGIDRGFNKRIKEVDKEMADDLLKDAAFFTKENIDAIYERVYGKLKAIDDIAKMFNVKKYNPTNAKHLMNYQRTAGDAKLIFEVSGMDDSSARRAHKILTETFNDIASHYEQDNDKRWLFIAEGLKEAMRRNNIIGIHIVNDPSMWSKEHIHEIMNQLRMSDEHPVLVSDEVTPAPVEKEAPVETTPVTITRQEEPVRTLKSSGGFFDKFFKDSNGHPKMNTVCMR